MEIFEMSVLAQYCLPILNNLFMEHLQKTAGGEGAYSTMRFLTSSSIRGRRSNTTMFEQKKLILFMQMPRA